MPFDGLLGFHIEHLKASDKDVLRFIAQGKSHKDVAEALDISVEAVRGRLKRFHTRYGLSGPERVAWAADHQACCLAA